MLERNVGAVDRIIRAGLGTLLLGSALRPFAARRRSVLAGIVGLTGVVLLFTAATGHCGVYDALSVSTYRR